MKTSLRSHVCNEIDVKDVNRKVSLCGWVSSRRDHGGVIFIDLRDRYGITQVVFDPSFNKHTHEQADYLRREDCIQAQGIVKKRKKGMENKNLKTGKIEIFADKLHVFSKADVPPFEIDDRIEANEELRLKYRYLDLRRPIMQHNLRFRNKVTNAAREYFANNNFLEVETPLLVRSTPEGARDYIVPSRVNLGKFYALPQSPQIYKQILMISGCDRYFHFARCLRDEDLRQDRQPEHTQIDLEICFVNSNDIREIVEGLYKHIFNKALNIKLGDFPVFTYKEVMDKYGTDKPDLRFGLELVDVTEIVKDSEFKVFNDVISKNGIVKCLYVNHDFNRKEADKLVDFCVNEGAKGLAWMRYDKKLESNIVKFFSKDIQNELIKRVKAKKGYLFFAADKKKKVNEILSKLRLKLGNDLKLIKNEFKFCWVIDFPLFAYNEEEERWEPEHHMFTMPKEEFIENLEDDPGEVLGDLFDLVLNGIEIGSGSIRISRPDVQERIMKIIGLKEDEAREKFGFLLDAYKYASGPHGGMGLGFDRLVALMLGINDIREVIAFPKNKAAQNPMDGSPSKVDDKQLKELGIKLDKEK